MKEVTVNWLRAIDYFKDVPDEQLQWFIDSSSIRELPAGGSLFRQGDEMPGPFVILSGKVILSVPQGKELHEAGTFEPGSIGGHLPFSRGKFATIVAEAAEDVRYLVLPRNKLDEMIRSQFLLTQALVHVMANRIREATAFQQQNEKMMALGKLSAGLAHELNNPAAAVVSGAAALIKHLKLVPDAFKRLMSLRLDPKDVDLIADKLFAALSRRPVLSMMERSALEDDILERLEKHDLSCAAETAENLVDFGFSVADLDDIEAQLPADAVAAVLNWINSNLVTEKIVTDVQQASGRIADLVGAVKNYTHMDQGHGRQLADIHVGIRSTITMLQHKIRNGNVQVVEEFDTGLPEVNAMVGELNQVWTNLLDNALDAMEPNRQGRLTITTGRAKDCVRITVSDDGCGIPGEVKSRIFDPFFTTKQIGKGTGLGLDVVMRIVRQHKGAVRVQSVPGRTDFIVEFPIKG
ncbi:sensor histidine kinase [Mucilaginibacter defluvii]|uniref:histidine kinase n=1 Tax=Mucilaginibacter defluvii TaxID=1196019 RepID=A0ABP9FUP2_9SPHI